jgi:hypothetical protein
MALSFGVQEHLPEVHDQEIIPLKTKKPLARQGREALAFRVTTLVGP